MAVGLPESRSYLFAVLMRTVVRRLVVSVARYVFLLYYDEIKQVVKATTYFL